VDVFTCLIGLGSKSGLYKMKKVVLLLPVTVSSKTRMSSVEEESPRRGRMSSQEEEDDESDVSQKGGHSTQKDGTRGEARTSHKRRRENGGEDEEEKDHVADDDDEEEDDGEEEDEEDDEDEDSDEDGGTTRLRRPRKKQRRANMFLDVEAEVDEDEEELEEEDDDLGGEDGFIQEHDLENEEIDAGDDRRHRDLDRKRQEITDKDAERLAEEFREKYGRSAASRYRGDGAGVAQRLLLPSVDDPSIWAIKCKTGKETDIITQLAKRMMVMESRGQSLGITSAFQRDSLEGYIYVEARKAAFVAAAVKDIPNVYATKLILVPIQEMPDLLRVKQQTVDLVPGSYVRIKTKSSKYAGDLAQVDNVDEDGTHARLRLVPRLDFSGKQDVMTPDGKRLKKALPLSFRPPARLFNEAELMYVPQESISDNSKSGGAKSLGRRGRVFTYLGDDYEDGYLVKDFRISALRIKDVNPTLEEITKFASGTDETGGIDLTSLAAGIKAASKSSTFQAGDIVEVFEGEQAGVHGSVESVTNEIATIVSLYSGLKGQRLEVPIRSLRKRFKSGDHVKVVNGRYKDDTGMVVRVVDDQVTFLSDMSMKEVFSMNDHANERLPCFLKI
jgi:transcription elongation factor SPT5